MASSAPHPSPAIRVHHRGERGVDGILRLIELADQDGPLEPLLTVMCDEIAAIAGVDVASIYVREGEGDDDRLVMRGNHGFSRDAIGVVTLRIGEGITGLVAECMRPVSAAKAASEASYKHVPGLGEERFPVFAGIPLIGAGRTIGVLVLQRRRSRAFTAADVALATALGAPITLALERHRAAAARSARLPGVGLTDGLVLGRAAPVPTSTALAVAPTDLPRAILRVRDDLDRARHRLAASIDEPDVGGALDRLALALMDQRLRERLDEAVARPAGLREVARDYARVPYKTGGAPGDRESEIEELCVLIGASAGSRAILAPGAVWLADRLGAFLALAAIARGAVAVVVASGQVTDGAHAIARAARLPVVASVTGAFAWTRPGDLLAVDATAGEVVVNPAPADVERLRRVLRGNDP
jgi:phosphotransferase system enzyme I (PtsP)